MSIFIIIIIHSTLTLSLSFPIDGSQRWFDEANVLQMSMSEHLISISCQNFMISGKVVGSFLQVGYFITRKWSI